MFPSVFAFDRRAHLRQRLEHLHRLQRRRTILIASLLIIAVVGLLVLWVWWVDYPARDGTRSYIEWYNPDPPM